MEIKVVGNQNEVYVKDKLLGEGAFGKAYLVKHKETNEQLVIKQMSIQHMSSKEREETIKEAQILKSLNHPNIVNFKEVYITKNNKLKIVMEYAECGDLAKAISLRKAKKSNFDEKQVLDWFTQICLAIKHVHDRKILHRDIKGQNIFISKNNSLKLGDFGIARVLNKTHEKARTVVGTPYYLSPEIIQNKPYSFKSDIWSIGAVLYQMCALAPPFTAASLQMLALKIVKGSYPPIAANYSKQLKSLVAEMLTLDPNRRPSVNQILQKPLIQDRIRGFLSETKRIAQFSHTVLHNQKVEIFANKLVQIQKEKEAPRSNNNSSQSKQKKLAEQRNRLKEQQRIMQLKIQKKKEEEQRKRQDDIRRKQLEANRREEEKKKWLRIEQQKKEQMQRDYQENARRAQVMKARRYQQEREYQRKMEIQELQRQKYQYEDRKRRQFDEQKKKNKMMEDERKKQQLNDFARKQYFENLQIRKRAQQRAKRQQQGFYSEPHQPQPQPENQNFHYQHQNKRPVSSYENQRPSSKDRDRKPNNSDCYNRHPLNQPEPTEQQIQNAYLNPNFNRKRTQEKKKSSQPKQPSQRRSSIQNTPDHSSNQKKEDSKKRIQEARQKMRKDREKYMRGNGMQQQQDQGATKQEQKAPVGKWGKKKSTSRERQIDSPRFGQRQMGGMENVRESPKNEEGKGFDTLIHDSQNMFLQAKDPQQFGNYLDELEGILNDVHKKIEMLPEIPVAQEILFRDDDELQFSLTAQPDAIKKKDNNESDMDTDEVDLDYFSNYSKLQTLRIQLEEAFGLDNFIRLYRYIEKQVCDKGLQGFDIVQAIKEVGTDIDRKIITKNLTLLLTLVSLEDRMTFT